MPTYYTERGDIIYNSTAYAKTGAPMYKTKYGNTTNINQETDIYKLKLENGKKYIGKTVDIDRRMDQHFSGIGAKVTQKFKPIEGEVIDTCPGYFANKVEQKHTDKNIKKHGYTNVRGGKYTNSTTLKPNVKLVSWCDLDDSDDSDDLESWPDLYDSDDSVVDVELVAFHKLDYNTCYRCGRTGHFANNCYAKTHISGYKL